MAQQQIAASTFDFNLRVRPAALVPLAIALANSHNCPHLTPFRSNVIASKLQSPNSNRRQAAEPFAFRRKTLLPIE